MRWFAALSACALSTGCITPEVSSRICGGFSVDQRLLVLESDLRTTSGLGAIDTDGCLTEIAGGLALGGDTALSASAGRVFVLDRGEGLVHEVDPIALRITRTELAHGGGEKRANPQDVALDDAGRRWVTRFDRPTLSILGGQAGWTALDLSAFADADGLPEAAAIHIAAGRAHVALQRLDAAAQDEIYPPAGPGRVLSIDVERAGDLSAIDVIELSGGNPFGRFAPAPFDATLLVIATPGSFGGISPTDGIELIDTAAGSSRVLLTEAELGGSATEALLAGPDEGYAIVAGAAEGVNPTRVVAFDPLAGVVTRTLAEAEGYYHWGLALAGRHVVVGDRTPGSAGIRFYERETGALAGVIAVQQMAPVSLLALPR